MASRSETIEAVLFALCVGLFFGEAVRFRMESGGARMQKRDLLEHPIRGALLSLSLSLNPVSFFSQPDNDENQTSLPRLHLLYPPSLPQGHLPRARSCSRRAIEMARPCGVCYNGQRDADGKERFLVLFF